MLGVFICLLIVSVYVVNIFDMLGVFAICVLIGSVYVVSIFDILGVLGTFAQ